MDTQQTTKFAPREKERKVHWKEEEEAAKDILSLGFLSSFDIVLSDESIQKKLLGFLSFGFPRIKIFVSIFYVVLVYLSVILVH